MPVDLTTLQPGDLVAYALPAVSHLGCGLFLRWETPALGAPCLLMQSLEFRGGTLAVAPERVLYRCHPDDPEYQDAFVPLHAASARRVNDVLQLTRTLAEHQELSPCHILANLASIRKKCPTHQCRLAPVEKNVCRFLSFPAFASCARIGGADRCV